VAGALAPRICWMPAAICPWTPPLLLRHRPLRFRKRRDQRLDGGFDRLALGGAAGQDGGGPGLGGYCRGHTHDPSLDAGAEGRTGGLNGSDLGRRGTGGSGPSRRGLILSESRRGGEAENGKNGEAHRLETPAEALHVTDFRAAARWFR
jgi:hypothetical protein